MNVGMKKIPTYVVKHLSQMFVMNEMKWMKTLLIFLTPRYTPSQQGVAFNSGAKQRVIRMVEMQKDPMEPPRFKSVVVLYKFTFCV